MRISDYFAELYVAGRLADAGWDVYFPHRDKGIDFIISKDVQGRLFLRPVQVKGKYPASDKTDKPSYGYVGKLSQTHPEMVLAIAVFSSATPNAAPKYVAYMPASLIKKSKRGYRCLPAAFENGEPEPRRDHRKFFDDKGIRELDSEDWKKSTVGRQTSNQRGCENADH